MFSLVIGFLLVASSAFALELPAVDNEDVYDVDEQDRPAELFRNDERNGESLVYEHTNSLKESFSWSDCGGIGWPVRVKSFSISPLPLQLPGNAIVALNATVDSDMEPPISLDMTVKKKVGLRWYNVCGHVPEGCHRKDICSTQKRPASASAAADEEEEDSQMETKQNPFCQMKKGEFSLPPTPFAVKQHAPHGWYEVEAKFRKGGKNLACLKVKLNIG